TATFSNTNACCTVPRLLQARRRGRRIPRETDVRGCAMFVQVIEGRVSDREGLRRQMDKWMTDLRPGATGFLGSTAGVTDDGKGIALARFESAAAARANSDRPEQGAWWNDTAKCYSGDVTFTESEDTETFLGGGSNDAGFVQIMRGTADRDQLHAMDTAFEQVAESWRPDLIGVLRV